MKKVGPLLSIVTVVKNGEEYLQQTITSVIEQNFSSMEYIVVDGGSSDNTLTIIQQNERGIDKWISEPDKGIFDGMNKGLGLSSGEWIWFLNSDDFLEKGILRRIFVENLNKLKGKDILYGNIRKFGEAYSYIVKERNLKNFKKNITFSHPATVVKKEMIENIGGFNPDYKIVADYDLFFRLSKTDPDVFYIDEVFTSMRDGGVSEKLSNSFKRIGERFRADRLNAGPGLAIKNFFVYLTPGLIKKLFVNIMQKMKLKKLINMYFKMKYPKK